MIGINEKSSRRMDELRSMNESINEMINKGINIQSVYKYG